MIDISDGLSSETLHLCKNSNVGGDLYKPNTLRSSSYCTCEEFNIDSTTIALNRGYGFSKKDFPKIKANPNLTVIGYITEKNAGAHLVTRQIKIELQAQGWKSFKSTED